MTGQILRARGMRARGTEYAGHRRGDGHGVLDHHAVSTTRCMSGKFETDLPTTLKLDIELGEQFRIQ